MGSNGLKGGGGGGRREREGVRVRDGRRERDTCRVKKQARERERERGGESDKRGMGSEMNTCCRLLT